MLEIAPGAPIDVHDHADAAQHDAGRDRPAVVAGAAEVPEPAVRAVGGRDRLDPLLARADRLRVPAAPVLDPPGLRRQAPEPGRARPLHVLLHQRPRRRRRARQRSASTTSRGSATTRTPTRRGRTRRSRWPSSSTACPTTSRTRSRTRTRCASSGTTRSRTGRRSRARSARCAPRCATSDRALPARPRHRCRSSGTSPALGRAAARPAPRPRRSPPPRPAPGPTMNVTTQSSQAAVCCITHSSQSISIRQSMPTGYDSYDQSGTGSSEHGCPHQHAIDAAGESNRPGSVRRRPRRSPRAQGSPVAPTPRAPRASSARASAGHRRVDPVGADAVHTRMPSVSRNGASAALEQPARSRPSSPRNRVTGGVPSPTPASDAMLTIAPPPRSRIARMA